MFVPDAVCHPQTPTGRTESSSRLGLARTNDRKNLTPAAPGMCMAITYLSWLSIPGADNVTRDLCAIAC